MNQNTSLGGNFFLLNYLLRIFFIALIIFAVSTIAFSQTITPEHYWTFNGATIESDSVANGDLDFAYYGSGYNWNFNGLVNKYVSLDTLSSTINASSLSLDSSLCIEFLFKPNEMFNSTTFFLRRDNAFKVRFSWPYIVFYTKHTSHNGPVVVDDFRIHLNGIGRREYGYYIDGNWHHMVFKFSAKTGKKEVWVDGQLGEGFSKTVDPGYFVNSDTAVLFNHSVPYRKYFGDIDEIAFYNIEVPSTLIVEHYQDAMNGESYTFVNDSTLTVPAAEPTTAGVDTIEFPIGHPNVQNNVVQQMEHFPTPRYKENHTLLQNFQWMNPKFFAGYLKPGVSKAQAVDNSIHLQTELVTNFNYSLMINDNTKSFQSYNDTTEFTHHWVNLANANPDWKTGAISFWGQSKPTDNGYNESSSYILSNNMPNNHYLMNANGDFLDKNGNITSNPSLSPAAPTDSFLLDGLTQRFYFEQMLSSLNRPLDFINENGEVYPLYKESALMQDSAVVADKNSTGLTWDEYQALRKTQLSILYKDAFLSLPALTNTKYSEYYISGNDDYLHLYSYTRTINTPVNGNYYSTLGFYPRWAHNWRYWISAWAGWQWIVENRQKEIALGDKFYSPFVGAGWHTNPEINVRPAQYLGLLKCLGMTGAEYYYSALFNTATPFPDSDNYAWQGVYPSYSQAVTSWYEDVFRNGHLMDGDVPDNYTTPDGPGYSFDAHDFRKLIVARKHDTMNKYAITGTIQNHSNMANATEKEADASIQFEASELQFKIRRQGSTYIYDNTNTSAPVFYQVDGWHEFSHPERWSTDFEIEAELFQSTSSGASLATEVPAGALPGDFRDYTTYVHSVSTDSITYHITNRIVDEYYIWVRARNNSGVSKSMDIVLDNTAAQTISCIDDTDWNWYTIKACLVESLNGLPLSRGNHSITLVLPANIELDKLLITKEQIPTLDVGNSTCSGSYSDVLNNLTGSTELNVTRSKQNITCNNFSNGNISVNVTGGAAPYTFEWSTSPVQTSSTIQNLSGGFYTVTVTDANQCYKKATIEIREPSALISFFIPDNPTAPGTNTGSIDQLVSGGVAPYTFIWFPVNSVTEDLDSVVAGVYFVTVVDANGCAMLNSVALTDPPAVLPSGSQSSKFVDSNNLNVYPVPFENRLNVYVDSKTAENVAISLRDLSGRVMYYSENGFNPLYSINTSDFSAGMYLIEVKQGDKVNRLKVFKSK